MKKIRTYKKYTVVYELEKEGAAFRIAIEKNGLNGFENSSYVVNGEEKELKALLCRLWACGVTPMSLVYILEDEGYIPSSVDNDEVLIKTDKIVKRKQACLGENLKMQEKEGDDKCLIAVGGQNSELE